ncbi:hypothetical protein CHS0354_004101 [Potamilus streckersoni]|uniref:C-type lectin domain-containing protein n=1 Tax=Potamilus streckersoni TaxID=2493646 RepID=A0AAE0VXJ2_9BIVA|nr:hypothetical protein CHS0354_004101 [Potamilus streckersoni]
MDKKKIKKIGTSLGCGLSCSFDKTCFSFFYHAKRKECRGSPLPHQHLDGAAILENGWVYFLQDSEDLSSITMTFSTPVTLPIDSLEPATSTTKRTTQPLDPFGCTTPPASKPTACPASYICNDSPKLCYRAESSSIRSWHEAKCYCEEGGGHLIKIDKKPVWRYIREILESGNFCDGFYVGGNDLDVLGT